MNDKLDELPFPDWKSLPIENYWKLGYAHGPVNGSYLPILTSRGCPLPCQFCVIPSTNDRRWRPRSAKNSVDEMEFFQKELAISDFHFEDVNPTVRNGRIVDFCKEIISRGLKLNWKIVSGTKIETMRIENISLMANSGCNYISFSPETGSPELLKKMKKPFRHDLALKMVREMRKNRIYSQSCFVLGYPEETWKDRVKSLMYIAKLVFAGIDEIAVFLITPIPGTAIYEKIQGFTDLSQLTFSPTWRKDYQVLKYTRLLFYLIFIFLKTIRSPFRVLKQGLNVVRGKFDTKMEQALFRVTFWKLYNRNRLK